MEPTTPTPTLDPTPRPTSRNVPQGDPQLSEVFDLAVDEWGLRPELTILWKTQPQALILAGKLRTSLRTTGEAADVLTPQSKRLGELDDMIDGPKKEGKLKYVMKALALQYDEEDDGKPYYSAFGIEKINRAYTLPHDRGDRAKALLKLVKALSNPEHQLADIKYGKAFWKEISDEYNTLQPKQAKDTGTRSTEVAGKNLFREEAEDILVALLFLLRANYPKTYQAERRKFGVLKESYS